MDQYRRKSRGRLTRAYVPSAVLLAMITLLATPRSSIADEAGVSFWLPGQFGSLAAVPATPGFSYAGVYYHTSVEAGRSSHFKIGGGVQAGLQGRGDLLFLNGTYTFATPVLGGQAAIGLTQALGNMYTHVDAMLSGPFGNTISGSRSDSRFTYSDLYPMATLKWNSGVNNFMVYTMWDLPVGNYEPDRLSNIGIGHWAMDYGFGYTYLNPQNKIELSAVLGFTYNFKNPYTNYQNGIDAHLDWGASVLLSKQVHVGLVGYVYHQITGDSGAGAVLGAFKSQVAGVGPQISFFFPAGDEMQGYLNLKVYKEFAAVNRPEGWNAWVTLGFSSAPPTHATAN